jgi:hypothetical protein
LRSRATVRPERAMPGIAIEVASMQVFRATLRIQALAA